ncbi:MAG: hypothetical protein SVU32_03175 [Candidatus Nanohaloarchaea archaeon]|nr:hypothetical protein [Candidatus Nanohaloarchaea archaeon]
MSSRPKYDDAATTARMYAEAVLAQTQEYIGAFEQVEVGLPEAELERYETGLAAQLEEADRRYDEAFEVDVFYDRREEETVIPGSAKDHDEYYQELDDAYVAMSAAIDALEAVEEQAGRDILDEVDLERNYAHLESLDQDEYEEHLEAMGLDRL